MKAVKTPSFSIMLYLAHKARQQLQCIASEGTVNPQYYLAWDATGQGADSQLSPEFHKTHNPSSAVFHICDLSADISNQLPSSGREGHQ